MQNDSAIKSGSTQVRSFKATTQDVTLPAEETDKVEIRYHL
jgi:hypothetical protein